MCNCNNLKDNNNLKYKYCGSDKTNNSGEVIMVIKGIYVQIVKGFTITKRKYSEEYKLKIIKIYLKRIRNFGKMIKERLQK